MAKLKELLFPLLSGISVLLIMVVFMTQISIDFRIVLIVSNILLFGAGFLFSKKETHAYLLSALIVSPYSIVFGVLLYPQIPQLLSFIPLFAIATFLGVIFRRNNNTSKYYFLGGYALANLLISILILPSVIENQLTDLKNEEVQPFTIVDMNGNKLESSELRGKIVVMDFFGTWCKPCVQELKELNKIQGSFKDNNEVVFFVVNSAEAGDTVEKMNKFIAKNNYPFHFAFDHQQKLVKQFDLHGVPYLFIFDKQGNHRYEHFGYNKAEANFVNSVTKVINDLIQE